VVYYSQGKNPNVNKKRSGLKMSDTLKATIMHEVEILEDEELLILVYSFILGIIEGLGKDNASA
jgi:hypothetical protein